MLDCKLGSTTGETSSDGTSFLVDLVGVAYPLDRACGGFDTVDFGDGAVSFESLRAEIIDGAGDAEDRARLSEVEREDESFRNIVDSLDLALWLSYLISKGSSANVQSSCLPQTRSSFRRLTVPFCSILPVDCCLCIIVDDEQG